MSEQIITRYIYCLPAAVKTQSVRFGEYEIMLRELKLTVRQEQLISQIQRMSRLKQKRHAYAIPRKLSHVDGFKSQRSILIELKYFWQKVKYKRALRILKDDMQAWQDELGSIEHRKENGAGKKLDVQRNDAQRNDVQQNISTDKLCNDFSTEIVLCAELQKQIPKEIWTSRMRDTFPRRVHEAYCMDLFERFLEETKNKRNVSVYVALAKEETGHQFIERRIHQIMELVKKHQSHLSDLIFFSTSEQETDYMDSVLESFEEETGIAASCYETLPGIKLNAHSMTDRFYLVADFYGMSVNEICGTKEHELYYLDGMGSKARKEIRRMNANHIHVKSLVNSLDRGFVGGL